MLEKLPLNKALHILFIFINVSIYGCNNSDVNKTTSYTTTVTNTTIKKDSPQKDLPKVVATTSVLCDLTKQIAEKTINLTCLTPPSISRSEEHTSELQSQFRISYAVFCLKKKIKI